VRGRDVLRPRGALYEAFTAWAAAAGEEKVSKRKFGLMLKERAFQQGSSHSGARIWLGLRLKTTIPEPSWLADGA
jgi:hypothetical protein